MQLTRQGFFPTYVLQTCLALVRHYSWYLVLRLILFIGGQLLEGVYLSPRIMGRETGLHPVVVLVAILVGGTLFGLLGIVLAVPFTAVLQVCCIVGTRRGGPPGHPLLRLCLRPLFPQDRARVRSGERESVTLAGMCQDAADQGRIGEVGSGGGFGKARVALRIGQNPW